MEIRSHVETYAQLPFQLVEGSGARVRNDRGELFWDLYGGHAVAILGHSHPEITEAIAAQAARLTFYSNVVPMEVRDRAAQKLCDFAPTGLDKVFFCNSGAEANENALKVAVQQTGRHRIAALEGGFHGRTLLALAATASDKLRAPYLEMLPGTVRIKPNDPEDLGRVDDTVAAVIVEPILSIAGVVELDQSYLISLKRRCDEVGALLIFDEIQTGMGRLGHPFAASRGEPLPHMVTLAKGIANGIPMGAVLFREEVASKIAVGDLGSTFGGGPVACAALKAVLTIIAKESLVKHANEIGAFARRELVVGPVREVLGSGCLLGLRLDVAAKPLHAALLEHGFITGTSSDPEVLRLLPPINLPFEALEALAGELKHL